MATTVFVESMPTLITTALANYVLLSARLAFFSKPVRGSRIFGSVGHPHLTGETFRGDADSIPPGIRSS